MVFQIVLIRHGESVWNKENKFTGWKDVDLSETGKLEAVQAGKILRESKFEFDVVYTSVLKRAIKTMWTVLDELDQCYLPVTKDWRLNERHYGELQGLNKAETAAKHGEEQVKIWRRSYDIPPPPLDEKDERFPANEAKYKNVDKKLLPRSESLKDTVARFLPAWHEMIAPTVKSGQRVLIVAHGNSLRALVKYLDNMSESDIIAVDIPTGVPLVYELDDDLKPIKHYYLADQKELEAKMQAVANQGKAKK